MSMYWKIRLLDCKDTKSNSSSLLVPLYVNNKALKEQTVSLQPVIPRTHTALAPVMAPIEEEYHAIWS